METIYGQRGPFLGIGGERWPESASEEMDQRGQNEATRALISPSLSDASTCRHASRLGVTNRLKLVDGENCSRVAPLPTGIAAAHTTGGKPWVGAYVAFLGAVLMHRGITAARERGSPRSQNEIFENKRVVLRAHTKRARGKPTKPYPLPNSQTLHVIVQGSARGYAEKDSSMLRTFYLVGLPVYRRERRKWRVKKENE